MPFISSSYFACEDPDRERIARPYTVWDFSSGGRSQSSTSGSTPKVILEQFMLLGSILGLKICLFAGAKNRLDRSFSEWKGTVNHCTERMWRWKPAARNIHVVYFSCFWHFLLSVPVFCFLQYAPMAHTRIDICTDFIKGVL